jgi:hypothetical protein
MSANQKTIIVKNVTFSWVKLDTPIDNFTGDKMIYDIQCSVPVARAADLEQFRKVRPVKGDEGMVCINLSKNAVLRSGEDGKKVRVVDAFKKEMDSKIIGNGSIGNVMVLQDDYEILHPKTKAVIKSGTSSMLVAIQVTTLKEFVRKDSIDFDMESGNSADASGADEDQF